MCQFILRWKKAVVWPIFMVIVLMGTEVMPWPCTSFGKALANNEGSKYPHLITVAPP